MTPARDPGARTGRLWLVRHGETAGQSSIRFHGSNDVPLSDEGRAQIRALAPLLRGLEPALLVHSPLSRAAESAEILLSASGVRPAGLRADERLREISFGDCEGLTAEEIAAAHPEFWRARQQGEVDAFPGGESRRAFRQRVQAAIAELVDQHPTGDVVVVAHRGIVRTALQQLLGPPPELPPSPASGSSDPFAVRLGSVSVVRRGGQPGWVLELCDFVP